jgi:thiamine kinase-like enzyme
VILIDNNPHDNGLFTYKDSQSNLIIKSSYLDRGIKRLSQEYAGYKWYLNRVGLTDTTKLSLSKNEKGLYSRLIISCFPGSCGQHDLTLYKNQDKLLIAIDTYQKIWIEDNRALYPLHGDFSLGNILFRGGEAIIIDWEHFKHNAAPWGFDLVNMFYESTLMSINQNGLMNKKDIRVFEEIKDHVSSLLETKKGFDCKFNSLIAFYNSNQSIWDGGINKFPVINATSSQLNKLEQLDQL